MRWAPQLERILVEDYVSGGSRAGQMICRATATVGAGNLCAAISTNFASPADRPEPLGF